MDMHGTMASICKFNNSKSTNMENLRNTSPMKIKAHTVLLLEREVLKRLSLLSCEFHEYGYDLNIVGAEEGAGSHVSPH